MFCLNSTETDPLRMGGYTERIEMTPYTRLHLSGYGFLPYNEKDYFFQKNGLTPLHSLL